MRSLKPYLMLLVVFTAVCLNGVQGQNNMPSMSGPSNHISAPVPTLIEGQIQASPNNVGPSLWIQGDGGWTQSATIPQGSTATLIAISPTGGSGYLSEMLNGTPSYNSNFYFYPHSQLTFSGYAIGQYVLSYSLNGQSSNQVAINVTAYVPPKYHRVPYGYYGQYNYYPRSYYYPVPIYQSYEYGRYWSRFYGGYSWSISNYPWLVAP